MTFTAVPSSSGPLLLPLLLTYQPLPCTRYSRPGDEEPASLGPLGRSHFLSDQLIVVRVKLGSPIFSQTKSVRLFNRAFDNYYYFFPTGRVITGYLAPIQCPGWRVRQMECDKYFHQFFVNCFFHQFFFVKKCSFLIID